MKAIKLLMAVVVIGLFGASCSLGERCSCRTTTDSGLDFPISAEVDRGMISPFDEEWPTWVEDFDFGDDFVGKSFGLERNEPSYDAVSGDDGQDESSDGYTPVDDWIIDENFYSDFGGSGGEERGWKEAMGHPGIPGPDENALWIVFPYSNNVRTTRLVILKDRYAKELIIPGTSGTITIYEEGPDGTIETYVPGWYVEEKKAYSVWFLADSVGNHTVWYEVYNEKTNVTTNSNEIKYRVFQNLAVVVPNEVKCEGETAIMRALVAGCDNPVYQWFKGITSATGEKLTNETESVYIIRNVSPEVAGYYTCKVTCDENSVEDAGRLFVGTRECTNCECCYD